MYLQPDMEKTLIIYMECDYEEVHEVDYPDRIKQRTFRADCRSDIGKNDIQETLEELYDKMFNIVDDTCEEQYDIVRLNKLYFTIGIWIETDDWWIK